MSTPLNNAIDQRHIDAIHLLLDHGAEVTEGDLRSAFKRDVDEDLINRLMDHNNTSVNDDMMYTAIHKYSTNTCLNLLYRELPKWWNEHEINPLHAVASSRNCDLVEPFVAYGIDINKIADFRYSWELKGVIRTSKCTPLHIAPCYLNADMFITLLKHGANKTIKDHYNRTPMDIIRVLKRHNDEYST
jgi:hypothetical protein